MGFLSYLLEKAPAPLLARLLGSPVTPLEASNGSNDAARNGSNSSFGGGPAATSEKGFNASEIRNGSNASALGGGPISRSGPEAGADIACQKTSGQEGEGGAGGVDALFRIMLRLVQVASPYT